MTKQEVNNTIQKIVNKIVNDFDPAKVILFGSHAWGEPGENSDVDLCIIKQTDDSRQLARRIDASLTPRYIPLDLLVFPPESVQRRLSEKDPFMTEIINRGTLLYEK